jgi:hypothetical protein
MSARPGFIRALILDTFALSAVLVISATPLFAESMTICYANTGEGCDWVKIMVAKPHDLVRFPVEGETLILNTYANLQSCRDAMNDALATAERGVDFSCKTVR